MQHWLKVHRAFFILITSVALLVLIPLFFAHKATAPVPISPGNSLPANNSTVAIKGEIVCLPHKDTSGAQTMECAYGLLSEGVYYSLAGTPEDNSLVSKVTTGDKVLVTGQFTIKDDKVYDIKGVISVTALEKL